MRVIIEYSFDLFVQHETETPSSKDQLPISISSHYLKWIDPIMSISYYEVLHVRSDATPEELKRAYVCIQIFIIQVQKTCFKVASRQEC